jgi:hypothetical protein
VFLEQPPGVPRNLKLIMKVVNLAPEPVNSRDWGSAKHLKFSSSKGFCVVKKVEKHWFRSCTCSAGKVRLGYVRYIFNFCPLLKITLVKLNDKVGLSSTIVSVSSKILSNINLLGG